MLTQLYCDLLVERLLNESHEEQSCTLNHDRMNLPIRGQPLEVRRGTILLSTLPRELQRTVDRHESLPCEVVDNSTPRKGMLDLSPPAEIGALLRRFVATCGEGRTRGHPRLTSDQPKHRPRHRKLCDLSRLPMITDNCGSRWDSGLLYPPALLDPHKAN